jgi:hypothetical protein
MKNFLPLFCSTFLFLLIYILPADGYVAADIPVTPERTGEGIIQAPDSTREASRTLQDALKKGPFHQLNIKVYPNPGKGLFNIEMNNKEPMAFRFKVYNLTGKEVLTQETRSVTACKTTLNLTPYSDGIYLLSIQTGNHKKVIKLLKQ